jgi:pyruvate dehydrogenase E2 component (dihydrolipoamide acetyltransferase)
MIKEFRLPDAGEGLTEADIVSWHVKPGDTVTVNQVIVEIETAKAVVELPSPWDGTISKLLVSEGQTVDVGVPIIAVEVADAAGESPAVVADAGIGGGVGASEDRAAADRAAAAAEVDPDTAGAQSVLVGYGVRPTSTTRRRRVPAATAPAPAPASNGAPVIHRSPSSDTGVSPVPFGSGGGGGSGGSRALAKPPVRKLAKDLGVDLAALTGSGTDGVITREDVQRAASAPSVPTAAASGGERIPVRGVRKHTAAAMVASAFTAPHVTEFLQVDMTDTMAAVRRVRELPEFADVKVSPLLFVARALLVAAARYPMINSSWDEAAQEIVVHGQVNLGIAVATARGLIVPNVKDAGSMPMATLARSIDGLARTGRDGKATPADLSGGTITITNVGVFGVDAGTPILTPGEAAIIAFGQVRDMPWVVDGQIAVRRVTTLSLSFDHRIVDGELGSAVLRDVGSMLEDPVRLLAWS